MTGLQRPPSKTLQRIPGLFVGSRRPRNAPIIDLSSIPGNLDELHWVDTGDDDYDTFVHGYTLVDLIHTIVYHLPTAAEQEPFSESAHSKTYWDHKRCPEWELVIRQSALNAFPARHHTISRWSDTDGDTINLLVGFNAPPFNQH